VLNLPVLYAAPSRFGASEQAIARRAVTSKRRRSMASAADDNGTPKMKRKAYEAELERIFRPTSESRKTPLL
jgi:hypothetical protein